MRLYLPHEFIQLDSERVLYYLYRARHLGLTFKTSERELMGYSDSDWGVQRSTNVTGYVFLLNSAAVSWLSKRQPSVALSSCEAEIMAASETTKEGVFLDNYPDTRPSLILDERI